MATEQYASLARYHDPMYHWKDYATDSGVRAPMIVERGQPVRHVVDRHEMWCCPHELLESTFERAGFRVTWSDALERRLLVGIRE